MPLSKHVAQQPNSQQRHLYRDRAGRRIGGWSMERIPSSESSEEGFGKTIVPRLTPQSQYGCSIEKPKTSRRTESGLAGVL